MSRYPMGDDLDWVTGMCIAIVGLMLIIGIATIAVKHEQRKSNGEQLKDSWKQYALTHNEKRR